MVAEYYDVEVAIKEPGILSLRFKGIDVEYIAPLSIGYYLGQRIQEACFKKQAEIIRDMVNK